MRRLAALIAVAAATSLGLLAVGGPATHATFPDRNGRIAFAGETHAGAEIYTIKPDGTRFHRLTHLPFNAFFPDWSPDGTRIAFSREFDEGVYVMNADGSDVHKVTGPGAGEPAFTPDGHHLVYWCDGCPGGDGVFLIRDDGSDAPGQRLSSNPFPEGDENPEVSPNGHTVTFVRHKVGGKLQALCAVDIDGGHLRRLTTYRLEVAIKHDWAPNGRQITLTSHADYPDRKSPNVATIKPDGSHLRLLTDHRGGESGAFTGSYSPNGRRIVYRFENPDRKRFRLFKMHPDGTHRKLIKRLPFAPRFSDWGPRP
jgi:Tol biopolymer transport system component